MTTHDKGNRIKDFGHFQNLNCDGFGLAILSYFKRFLVVGGRKLQTRPYGGHSHMSVYIKCLSLDTLLTPILHQMTPFFVQSTPKDPVFPLLYQILHTNCKFSQPRAHFEKLYNLAAILTYNLQILAWNCIFAHWMIPFWRVHTIGAHTEWPPFFWRNITPNVPTFVLWQVHARHFHIRVPPGSLLHRFETDLALWLPASKSIETLRFLCLNERNISLVAIWAVI